jgi:integrase
VELIQLSNPEQRAEIHPQRGQPHFEHQLLSHHAALHQYENLFQLWTKSSPNRRATTIEDYWKVLRSFADVIYRKPLTEITRKDVVGYRDQILEAGQSATTAGRKIGILKTLFLTGLNYELLETNPADNIRTPVSHDKKSRVAFTSDDLAKIFNSEIYVGGYCPKGAGREAAYWLPLLALFTGARIEELAQLLVNDVHYLEGLGHYVNITDEAQHSHLKNSASRRRIPVHPVLTVCGFIDYVARMKPAKFLFPHLKPNPRGKLGGYFSNFFSGYLRKKVKISDSRKVFHSFRHTFKDACRAVGIEEAVHDALTGHTAVSAGRKYGNEQYPLEPLFEAMECFEIPSLDLSHLYKKPFAKLLLRSEVKIISAYYGVVVAFAATKVKKELSPFVVALCDGAETRIDVATNEVIYGQIPPQKQILVNAWIEIHREELIASWNAGRLTGEYLKLDPLR